MWDQFRNPRAVGRSAMLAQAWRLFSCVLAIFCVFAFVSPAHAQTADLAITKTDAVTQVQVSGSTTYVVTVTNNGPSTVTGAVLRDAAVTGLTKSAIVCATAPGVCTAGTTPTVAQIQAAGGYALPTMTSGQFYRIFIRTQVTATSGNVTNTATITAPGGITDGTAGNNTSSDTNAVVTRAAGTAPTLTCPVGSTLFDWDPQTWTAGSTSNDYTIANIGSVDFTAALNAADGVWLNLAGYGGAMPNLQQTITGGLGTAQDSLILGVNMVNSTATASFTVTLPTAVPGAQFRIFDIDHNVNQYADAVTVTGLFNGSSVTPVLTNGIANYISGNSARSDALSADAQANGNITVTFNSPVDTITITYGNHNDNNLSPTDPGQQAISVHDITFCNPQAVITSTKISTVVSDGVSVTNPKAIPGAIMQYCITVNNAGSGTATTVSIGDTLPANTTYIAGSMRSGGTCGTATTVEDDDNAGADETDPIGMSIAGTTITGSRASMLPSTSFAMTFNATIN